MIDRATQQALDAEHHRLQATISRQAAELAAARERITELEAENESLRLERQEMGQALDQLLEHGPDLEALRAGEAAAP